MLAITLALVAYGLISRKIEGSILTGPTLFTVFGLVPVICPPKTRPSPVLESGRGQDTKGEGTMAAPKRLSPAQIINRLRKAEVALANGNTTKEVCRELGVSEQTYYRWRREYGGMKLSQAKRLKELEKENQQLKRAVAELTLDKLILKEASEGNF